MLAGWRVAAVVETALRHGVLALLRPPGAAAPGLARALGWDERGARLLLTALESLGLAERDPDGVYTTTELAQPLVVPGATPLAELIHLGLYGPGEQLAGMWNDLGASLARGGAGRFAAPEGDEARLDYLETLRDKAHRFGTARLAQELLPFAECRSLLDLGGSSGVFSFALVERHPQLRATVLDLPEMTSLARTFNAGRPGADRVGYHAADFFTDPLPRGHDAVLLANIVHDWTAAKNQRLISRAAEALEPGGRLAVLDVLLGEGTPSVYGALFGIEMFLWSEGEAYTEAEVAGWLRDAGLADVRVVAGDGSPYTIVTGRKPG